jgi:hypothetical protein
MFPVIKLTTEYWVTQKLSNNLIASLIAYPGLDRINFNNNHITSQGNLRQRFTSYEGLNLLYLINNYV